VGDWQPSFEPEHVLAAPAAYASDVYIIGWQGPSSLPIDTPFTFDATLIMQRLAPNGHDYWFTVQLLDQNGNRIASNTDGPILRWLYPTTQWAAMDRMPVSVKFDVPALQPGAYQLVVGLYPQFSALVSATNEAGQAVDNGLARVTWLKVPQPMPVTMPDTALKTDAIFADAFALVGVETHTTADHQTQVDLYWRSLVDQPSQDATIFVHLLDENGEILAQNDARPWNGQYPTFIWDKGEVVKTTHILSAAPENIHLRIGMYTFPGPQNLLLPNGDAAIEITD
jgi:hypothetical protein